MLVAVLDRRHQLSSAQAAAGIVSAVVPTVALVRGPLWAGLAAVALPLAARASSDEVSPTPRLHWLLFPVGALTLSLLSLVSSADRLRGGVIWRGCRYARADHG